MKGAWRDDPSYVSVKNYSANLIERDSERRAFEGSGESLTSGKQREALRACNVEKIHRTAVFIWMDISTLCTSFDHKALQRVTMSGAVFFVNLKQAKSKLNTIDL